MTQTWQNTNDWARFWIKKIQLKTEKPTKSWWKNELNNNNKNLIWRQTLQSNYHDLNRIWLLKLQLTIQPHSLMAKVHGCTLRWLDEGWRGVSHCDVSGWSLWEVIDVCWVAGVESTVSPAGFTEGGTRTERVNVSFCVWSKWPPSPHTSHHRLGTSKTGSWDKPSSFLGSSWLVVKVRTSWLM